MDTTNGRENLLSIQAFLRQQLPPSPAAKMTDKVVFGICAVLPALFLVLVLAGAGLQLAGSAALRSGFPSGRGTDGTLIFKGIYLGMHGDEVVGILRPYLEQYYTSQNETFESFEIEEQPNGFALTAAGVRMVSNKQGLLTHLTLYSGLTDLMFNSGDLSGDDFIQQFMDSYGIPGMEGRGFTFLGVGIGEYFYRSPDGWELVITTSKDIKLTKVTSEQELAFD